MTQVARLLVLACLLLAGCKTKMMPTPLIHRDGHYDPFATTAAEDLTPTPTVFFATDRNVQDDEDPAKSYGSERGIVLRLGRATVQLGDDGETWKELRDRSLSGDRPRMRVTSVAEFGPLWTTVPSRGQAAVVRGWDPVYREDPERQAAYAFASAVNEHLARSSTRDIVVTVPGVNTSFAPPVMLTAQLSHFMGNDGAFVAYCWPASGKVLRYNRDTETVSLTTGNLRDLLLLLSTETDVRKIHIIGYSRGAAVVSGALLQLRLIHRFEDVETIRARRKIGTVVYAGADEDLAVFKGLYLDQIDDVFDVVVIYSSPRDFALKLSSTFFGSGTERLGRPGKGLTAEDLQALREEMGSSWIDVDYAQERAGAGAHGHAFWYENPWVSSDLIIALRYGLLAAERGLVRDEDGAKWVFPPDYPERVRRILAE